MATKTELLKDAAGRQPGDEVTLTIREFIHHWGAQRRGFWYVRQINADLKKYDLVTKPPFEEGWIDNTIRLERIAEEPEPGDGTPAPEATATPSESQETSSTLMAGALTFADLERTIFVGGRPPLVTIQATDSLARAQSLMMKNDFSQLPVVSGGRTLKGAISWESMAKALAHTSQGSETTLMDCIVAADLLALSDDVLTNVPKITKNGFVVTKDHTNLIVGVVTTSDLSLAFQGLAGPFLLLGIAERLLRSVAEAGFTPEQIVAASKGKVTTPRPVDALSFGELQGLFASKAQWDELNWTIDRKVFLEMLDEVRDLRNQIMHFREELPASDRVGAVENMINWLRYLTA